MALFNRANIVASQSPRLADFIPTRKIETFHELPHVHFLLDGGLGYGWDVDVPAAESTDGAEEILSGAYAAMLAQVPPHYVLELYVGR